jgi:hypothetical protein
MRMEQCALTVGELCALRVISHADVSATSDAYLRAAGAERYPLATTYLVDVAAAVRALPFAAQAVDDPLMGVTVRRAAVCSAVLRTLPFSLRAGASDAA